MTKFICYVLLIAVIASTEQQAGAIRCNFVYSSADVVSSTNVSPLPYQQSTALRYDDTKNQPFKCEDPALDEFTEVNVADVGLNTRLDTDDDEFVQIEELCHSVKKMIRPKELNNVYDKLKRIAVVQTFSIEECVNPKSNCSRQPVPPNKRVLCKQNYLTIKLLALDDQKNKYEESFFYPSACSCATYMRKSDIE